MNVLAWLQEPETVARLQAMQGAMHGAASESTPVVRNDVKPEPNVLAIMDKLLRARGCSSEPVAVSEAAPPLPAKAMPVAAPPSPSPSPRPDRGRTEAQPDAEFINGPWVDGEPSSSEELMERPSPPRPEGPPPRPPPGPPPGPPPLRPEGPAPRPGPRPPPGPPPLRPEGPAPRPECSDGRTPLTTAEAIQLQVAGYFKEGVGFLRPIAVGPMPNPAKAGRPPLDLRRWTVPKPRVPPLKFHVNKEVKTGVWKEPEARLEGPHPPVTPPPARLLQGTDDSEPPPLPAKAMPLLFYSDTSEGDAKKRRTMMQPRGEETHDLLHEKEKDDGTTVSYRGRNTELPPTDDGTTVSYCRGGGRRLEGDVLCRTTGHPRS